MKLLFCYLEHLHSLRLGPAKRLMSWVGLQGPGPLGAIEPGGVGFSVETHVRVCLCLSIRDT